MQKRVFWHIRISKAQISQSIRAVWSRSSLSANIGYCRIINGQQKVRMILCALLWWFESAHAQRHFFAWRIKKVYLFKYSGNFTTKKENFQIKNSDIIHNSAQNIDYGYSLYPPRRGGSNEYPKYMFLSRNKRINVYPCKSQFYYIKVVFKGITII